MNLKKKIMTLGAAVLICTCALITSAFAAPDTMDAPSPDSPSLDGVQCISEMPGTEICWEEVGDTQAFEMSDGTIWYVTLVDCTEEDTLVPYATNPLKTTRKIFEIKNSFDAVVITVSAACKWYDAGKNSYISTFNCVETVHNSLYSCYWDDSLGSDDEATLYLSRVLAVKSPFSTGEQLFTFYAAVVPNEQAIFYLGMD